MNNQRSRSVSVGTPILRKEVAKSAGLLARVGVLASVPRMVAGGGDWWKLVGAGVACATVLLALGLASSRAARNAQGGPARRVAS